MPERTLKSLIPEMRERVGEWLRLCNTDGVPVLIYCTFRSLDEQAALYAQGRDANGARIPGKTIVTFAKPGFSAHNYGRALDAAPWEFIIERAQFDKIRNYIDEGRLDFGTLMAKKLDWSPFDTTKSEKDFRATFNYNLLDPRWRVMATRALEVELEWAGLWRSFIEYAHFQYLGGKTLAEIRRN